MATTYNRRKSASERKAFQAEALDRATSNNSFANYPAIFEFLRIRRFEIETLASCEGIYADMLHSVIESETGLYTSMGAAG